MVNALTELQVDSDGMFSTGYNLFHAVASDAFLTLAYFSALPYTTATDASHRRRENIKH